jgi:hypothetical protein
LEEVTLILPAVKLEAKVTEIETVPCPDTRVAPVGTVHVYPFENAPAVAGIVYVTAVSVPAYKQTFVEEAVIVPGVAGSALERLSVFLMELPQPDID